MVENIKNKFFPKDYQLTLYRHVQNIKQNMMIVMEYIKEFYEVNLRAGHAQDIL